MTNHLPGNPPSSLETDAGMTAKNNPGIVAGSDDPFELFECGPHMGALKKSVSEAGGMEVHVAWAGAMVL